MPENTMRKGREKGHADRFYMTKMTNKREKPSNNFCQARKINKEIAMNSC